MYFEELIKKIGPKLRGIAYKASIRFLYFNEEDLCQEALLHLWQDFNAGKLQDKTESYILQGCYFHLKNYMRKNNRMSRSVSIDRSAYNEDDNPGEVLFLQNEEPHSLFNYLNDKMLAETIQNNGLTVREKDIIGLCAKGLTTREIGARLNISHVRVVKLISRVRQKCKKYLDSA